MPELPAPGGGRWFVTVCTPPAAALECPPASIILPRCGSSCAGVVSGTARPRPRYSATTACAAVGAGAVEGGAPPRTRVEVPPALYSHMKTSPFAVQRRVSPRACAVRFRAEYGARALRRPSRRAVTAAPPTVRQPGSDRAGESPAPSRVHAPVEKCAERSSQAHRCQFFVRPRSAPRHGARGAARGAAEQARMKTLPNADAPSPAPPYTAGEPVGMLIDPHRQLYLSSSPTDVCNR